MSSRGRLLTKRWSKQLKRMQQRPRYSDYLLNVHIFHRSYYTTVWQSNTSYDEPHVKSVPWEQPAFLKSGSTWCNVKVEEFPFSFLSYLRKWLSAPSLIRRLTDVGFVSTSFMLTRSHFSLWKKKNKTKTFVHTRGEEDSNQTGFPQLHTLPVAPYMCLLELL